MKKFAFMLLGMWLFAFLTAFDQVLAQSWTLANAPTTLNWYAVASSADGTKLVAVVYDGPIYISTNSGINWVQQSANDYFGSVASSADGNTLVAASAGYTSPGGITISTNAGLNWKSAGTPSEFWASVCCSADGTKIFATSRNGAAGSGPVYASTNSGTTWFQLTNAPNVAWGPIACSADGSRLIAANNFDFPNRGSGLYSSTNFGMTWAESAAPIYLGVSWISVSSSSDGKTFYAAAYTASTGTNNSSPIYISEDSGVTWNLTGAPDVPWAYMAASSDGSKLVAVAGGPSAGPGASIFRSTNSGVTWTNMDAVAALYYGVASSADGNSLVAVAGAQAAIPNYPGGIYTYTDVQQVGSLQISLAPAAAVNAGAQWQVDGGTWQNSGATVSGLTVGTHPVAFNAVSGWMTPQNQNVTINPNQTTTETVTFGAAVPAISTIRGSNGYRQPALVQEHPATENGKNQSNGETAD